MYPSFHRHLRQALWPALIALAGCAGVPADRGLSDIQAQLQERGAPPLPAVDDPRNQQLIEELLAQQPLSRDSAVRIALLANPKLRSEYARLGLSGAEIYNAGRLSNPTFSASALLDADGNKITLGLAQSFADLLLLPIRSRLAKDEFERAKLAMGAALLDFAAEVEADYFRLVGAEQVLRMRAAVAQVADASAELAQRFFTAGNINRLELELNQAEAAQAQLDLLAAQSEVDEARAALNQRMGLNTEQNRWRVAEQLALPVAAEDDLPALLTLANKSRLDLAAAQRELASSEQNYGSTRNWRLLGDAEVGVETEREPDGQRVSGPTLALQLPLFHQGQGAVLRARSQLELSRAELDTLRLEISNGVQRAHARVATTRAAALRYQQDVVPQRERIVKLTQQQANYMLIGQFELIRAKQQEYDTYQKFFEALRDYWLARTELAQAVGARLPSDAPTAPAQDMPPAAADPGGHSHHSHH